MILKSIISINSDISGGYIKDEETVGEIFGAIPESEDNLVMMLKLVELVVDLEHRLEIEIKDELSDIASMKLGNFVGYVFAMV